MSVKVVRDVWFSFTKKARKERVAEIKMAENELSIYKRTQNCLVFWYMPPFETTEKIYVNVKKKTKNLSVMKFHLC